MAILALNSAVSATPQDGDLPHVLLVIDQLNKTLGGGERALLQLASHLPLRGFRVSILTFFAHPECPALRMTEAPIYLLPLERTYSIDGVRAAFEFRDFIRQKKILIVQTFFESSDIWAGLVTRTTSTAKLIWSRRDMGILREGKHRIAYRLMARVPHAVLAVSQKVREHCIEVDHIHAARVYTIYNGLNFDQFANAGNRGRNGHLVASVGNIRRVKGHDIFIRAAAIVARQCPQTQFSIAGEVLEPEYFQELQRLREDLGLSDRFRFEGEVTDLPRFLAGANIFVLPSRSEGFSNAIIEAMAASLPIVATRVGGNPEAVQHGVTGLLVPPEDPSVLADAVLELLSDSERANAMGEAGRRLASREFSTEHTITQVVEIYRRLLSTP